MTKRLNRVALALWVLAALYFAADFINGLLVAAQVTADGSPFTGQFHVFWVQVRSAIVVAGSLLGLGTLIELLDHIRWNTLSPGERMAHFVWFKPDTSVSAEESE